jgi:endonuclease/exonuclease/phosphatase family metal-dependent hydrolase
VRLATFNVLHGRSVVDGLVDTNRLRAAVRALDADILGLQEVDRDQPRSGGVDLAAAAAEAMGATECRFVAAINGTPGERWSAARDDDPVRGPAYGIALLSRVPVTAWHVVRLPALPVRSPVLSAGRRVILARDEPRVAVAAVVETGHRPVTVATTHLSFVPGWNVVQLRRVLAALRRLPGPQVLLGDLNIPGALPRALAAWRQLVREPTFPAPEPRVQLDHVLALGDLPPVVDATAPLLPLSDHRALVVELDGL